MVTWITQEKEGTHRNVITGLNHIVAIHVLHIYYKYHQKSIPSVFSLELGP